MILLANQEIRSLAYKRRARLTDQEVACFSKHIVDKLHPYLKGRVASYKAYGKEVNLSGIESCPNIEAIAYPRTYEDASMEFLPSDDSTQFVRSAYGIEEPTSGIPWDPQSIDVILVPLVAFDEQCHRIGHGKGYYDRYLTQVDCLKIGVAFSAQKVEELHPESHDIMMDLIITEDALYHK